LDLGARRVGVAVSDELRVTANPLPAIERRSWKDLLRRVAGIIEEYDAQALVIGLPLSLDGAEGSAAVEALATAAKFRRSLYLPVYVQDERLSTVAATAQLKEAGHNAREFFHPHSFASDSKGNLFIGEVNNGQRYYKYAFRGMGPATSTQ